MTNVNESEQRVAALKAIEGEVNACVRCSLASTRTHSVPGSGNFESIVFLVGEGPGFEEDRQGLPFVGRSGQFLTENLKRIGISRSEVFITNIVKCRPPENRDPEVSEIAACADYLDRQIALINPRIIVTLGRFSMGRWFRGEAISRIHGQVRNIGYGRVAIAMFHPAAALRNPVWKADFERDIEVLPGLIERARRANEAASRGEALPAGTPHPGDPDFRSPTPLPEHTRHSARSSDSEHGHEDGPEQLSLF
jgi:DNA polymerase